MMMENQPGSIETEINGKAAEEIKRLKLLVQQKDNEMSLLLSLINKKRQQQSGQNNDTVLGSQQSKE